VPGLLAAVVVSTLPVLLVYLFAVGPWCRA
jgi:hypothetical protein